MKNVVKKLAGKDLFFSWHGDFFQRRQGDNDEKSGEAIFCGDAPTDNFHPALPMPVVQNFSLIKLQYF